MNDSNENEVVVKEPLENEKIVVDDQKLNRIIKEIITLENDNVKTHELNDEDIKKQIQKKIEEELKCC